MNCVSPTTPHRTIRSATVSAGAALAILIICTAQAALAQTETILYQFCSLAACADGDTPGAALLMDASGNLYGTTIYGGQNGLGALYEINADGEEKVLYSFGATPSDGIYPDGGGALIMDAKGNLYGATSEGGSANKGTVFQVTPEGVETVMYSFCALSGCADGLAPLSGLARDQEGNLYGVTFEGGAYSLGTVFKLSPNGNETVLHSFQGGTDGLYPEGGLVTDSHGILAGTTFFGGGGGYGTVFKITTDGAESVIYAFCTKQNSQLCTDGQSPSTTLLLDKSGNIYGTTYAGGPYDMGTVFRIDANGVEKILHNFSGGLTDGSYPVGGLILDNDGSLYGTAGGGGAHYCGVVFKIDSSGTETILHNFADNHIDGIAPYGTLVVDSTGNLFGVTGGGGSNNYAGTVFELIP
jgi:uncharacterized repeat protein (TIGR03803 family)